MAEWIYLVGVVALAGFVQGLTGLGCSLVIVSLLLLADSPLPTATLTATVVCVFCQGVILLRLGRHTNFRSVWGLVVGAAVGVPVGLLTLDRFGEQAWLQVAFGAFVLLTSVWFLCVPRRPHAAKGPQHWLGVGSGLVSGLASGLFNTGGPPAVLYAYSRPLSFESAKVTVQWLFTGMAVYRFSLMLARGTVQKETALRALSVAPLIALGTFAGLKLAERFHPEFLRKAVFVLLILIGLKLCLWP